MRRRLKKVARAALWPERYRWWHAAAFGLAANVASGLRTGRREEDRRYYEGLEQARFAPPAWAFAPVWLINNASQLWGNLRLLNRAEGMPGRTKLLGLQGASWLLFATFNAVYFRGRSPVLGFAWTTADWLLTVASVALGLRSGRRDVAASLLARLAWLTLAVPVTAYQALQNPDPLLGYNPQGKRRSRSTIPSTRTTRNKKERR